MAVTQDSKVQEEFSDVISVVIKNRVPLRDSKDTMLGIGIMGCVFFFSSRRRHTRLQGDWSSDVCSSDLAGGAGAGRGPGALERLPGPAGDVRQGGPRPDDLLRAERRGRRLQPRPGPVPLEIGRASCREGV